MAKNNNIGISINKNKDFSKWYTEVIQKAELADYTGVSGCIVFRAKAYKIWEKIMEFINNKIKKLNVKNVYFPLLIPEKYLSKEASHVKGFIPEVAWVTHTGKTMLKERLAIRPTSETIMYPSFAKWIRSYKDLPLKLNQWCNIVRWEFKHPVPFLRTREFLWQEGHGVFETKNEADKEVNQILDIYEEVFHDLLAVPVLKGRKSEKEKFAGALYTLSVEALLPNGKAIQGATSHNLGQNFSRAFNITFLDKNEKKQHPWQTSWGLTTRSIGIMIAIHSDDRGLVLPPKLIERKIGIVPILFKDSGKKILAEANKIKRLLNKYGAFVDDREEYSPGWKFSELELKGIPLRIEIGPKDLTRKQVIVVKRNTSKKKIVKISQLKKAIPKLLDEMEKELFENAEKFIKSNITKTDSLKGTLELVNSKKIALAPMCSNVNCEDILKEKTKGGKILNIPFKQPELKDKKCIICNKKVEYICYIGKSY